MCTILTLGLKLMSFFLKKSDVKIMPGEYLVNSKLIAVSDEEIE